MTETSSEGLTRSITDQPHHRDGGESGDSLRAAAGPSISGRVVHCKREPYDVYIGRTGRRNGAFGNPFVMRSEDERQEVIEKFENYARAQIMFDPAYHANVKALYGKVLGCWCAPKACHGDVLLKLAGELRVADRDVR